MKRKVAMVFLAFFLVFSVFAEKTYMEWDVAVKNFFLETKHFQKFALNTFESQSYFRPSYFVISFDSKDLPEKIRHFYNINTFVEEYPDPQKTISTISYYSLNSLDFYSHLRLSFAFPVEEMNYISSINDTILRNHLGGIFEDQAQFLGIVKKAGFMHPRQRIDGTVLFEIIVIILLVILNIIAVTIYTLSSQKKHALKEMQVENVILASREIAIEKAKEKKEEIIDEKMGMFTAEYLKTLINDEITRYHIFEKKFCVVIFITQDTGNYYILKNIAGIITENLNKDIFSAYLGKGVFVSFFPNKAENDISIFVELTDEKIDEINVPVISKIYEYSGQKDFIESLNISGEEL